MADRASLTAGSSGGTLVVLHGERRIGCANRTARSRHAYTLHMVDGEATYSPDNWLQPEVTFRDSTVYAETGWRSPSALKKADIVHRWWQQRLLVFGPRRAAS